MPNASRRRHPDLPLIRCATLRSAINAAIREGLLRDNPARHVEVPSPRRPHALVWTAQRVEAWQKTGERPAVAVWTIEQTATFLSFVANDRLAVTSTWTPGWR
jgi:hypothetical protein